MNLGIVGTGNMGSTLIDGIYSTDCLDIGVFVYNRTREKIAALSTKYPQLNVCGKVEVVVGKSELLILAVPFSFIERLPDSVVAIIQDKQPLILALCGYVPMRLLQKYLPSKVAKAYPNVNWAVGKGVTIVHFGAHFNAKDEETILDFLARLGAVYKVSEDQLRPFSNLMSCGPALWAKMIDLFVEANSRKYSIDHKIGLELAQKTIEGTFQLMKGKGYSIEQVIKKVAGPGGTTEVGLKCFEEFLPKAFADTVDQISLRDSVRIQKLSLKE